MEHPIRRDLLFHPQWDAWRTSTCTLHQHLAHSLTTFPPSNPTFMHPLTPNPLKFIPKVRLQHFSRLLINDPVFQGCQGAEGGSLHTGSSRIVRMLAFGKLGYLE